MSKNLIWLAIGGVVAYLLLTGKKASATKVEEPQKGIDSTPKEPRSQSDCLEGEKFLPSVSAEDIVLTMKDGTTKIEKRKAEPARCVKIKRGRYGLPPLPLDSKPLEDSKELLDAMEEAKKMSIGKIMAEYNNLVCKMTAAKIKYTPEEAQKREIRLKALRSVALDRGVKLDCDINKNSHGRFKFSPVYDGNIKRLATGIN